VAAHFLRQVWEEIERCYAPRHVILFGSRATVRTVDVLCYTPEEFEVMGTGIGMVAEAAKEGIWLK
jgi:hypothetical protein